MTEHSEQLVNYLEADQLVIDRAIPLPPARLSRRATIALWILRVVVVVLGAMVIYTFVATLNY